MVWYSVKHRDFIFTPYFTTNFIWPSGTVLIHINFLHVTRSSHPHEVTQLGLTG